MAVVTRIRRISAQFSKEFALFGPQWRGLQPAGVVHATTKPRRLKPELLADDHHGKRAGQYGRPAPRIFRRGRWARTEFRTRHIDPPGFSIHGHGARSHLRRHFFDQFVLVRSFLPENVKSPIAPG